MNCFVFRDVRLKRMKRGSFHGIGVPDVGVVGVADGFDVEGVVNVGP